jgi:hypothetical protein
MVNYIENFYTFKVVNMYLMNFFTKTLKNNLFRIIILFIICMQIRSPLFAQQKDYPLFGRVIDKESSRPLPFANIREIGSTKGTMSNKSGYYYLMLAPGRHRIVFSYMGYRSDTAIIEIKNSEINLNVNLLVTSIAAPEVLISAYHLNPAERIIRKAIENKKKFKSGLERYEFEAYTKTVFTINVKKDSTKEVKDSAISQAMPVDSAKLKTNNGKDTVIAGLLESMSKGHWEKPDKYFEVITARRQTANFQPSNNIMTVGKIPDLNEDVISLENNLVIGPTAENAFDYYSYEMIDTTSINDVMVFRIGMKPKKEDVPLLSGIICIADSSFSVIDIDITGNSSLKIPMVKNLRCRQQYNLFEDKYWLPINIRMDFQINYGLMSIPPIMIEQFSLLYDYKINELSAKTDFDEYLVKVSPEADKPDSAVWVNKKIIPLTDEEFTTYHKMDSLMKNAGFFQKSLIAFLRFISEPTDLPITSFSDFYRLNRVEGSYLGAGFELNKIIKGTGFILKSGYSFAAGEWKYGFGIKQEISEKNKTYLGMELYKQISSRDDFKVYDLTLNTLYCLMNNFDYYDYYEAKGWRIYAESKLANGIKAALEFRDEDHKSLPRQINYGPLDHSDEMRINPPIDDGKFRLTKLSLDYDNRKFINTGFIDIPVGGENTWNISLSSEYTNKDFFKSGFEYLRNEFSLHRHQLTYASWSLDIFIRAGFASGTLPFQKLFELPGAMNGISSSGVFRTIGNKEFQGDNYAAIYFEHNFSNYFFRNIPLIKNLGLDFILNCSAGWIDFNKKSPITLQTDLRSTGSIFYEAGFSIGNILPFMKADFSWRLSHKKNNNFMFTIGSMMF